VIWVMAIVLAILIIIRIVLTCRGRFRERIPHGTGQTCGTRDVQEDCHAVYQTDRGTLAVLADGMGRNQCGKLASTLTIETVLDVFEREDVFRNPNHFFQKSLRQANRRILERLDESSGGASVAIVLIEGLTLYYAVAGNVQVAVFRDGELVPITEGHTISVLAQKKYLQGDLTQQTTIALLKEQRLYNFVGRDEFDIEIFDQAVKLKHGDVVSLMTDGVCESVSYSHIESLLHQGRDCQSKAKAIVQAVNESPGEKGNASVILIAV